MRYMLVLLALAVMTGCASRDELLARDRSTCGEIGFKSGTAEYSKCVLDLQAARLQAQSHYHH